MTEPRRKRMWTRALVVLGALVTALAGVGAWLASSEAAFAWTVNRLVGASGGGLEAVGVRGTLLGPVTAARIAYAGPSVRVEAREVRLEWALAHLLWRRLAIDRLEARHVTVRLAASDAPAALPADLALPIAVRLGHVRVDEVEIAIGEQRAALHGVRLGYHGNGRAHRVQALELDFALGAERASVRADAEIGAHRPYPLTAAIELAQLPARTARVQLGGTLARTEVGVAATIDGVPLEGTAALRPFESRWLEGLDARAQDVDLARLAGGAPRTAITVRVTASGETGETLSGEIAATNAAAGPVDRGLAPIRDLQGRFTTDMRAVRLAPMQIALVGEGRLEGSGDITADGARLALDARAISLRAIHSTLIETALAGRLEATLAADRQALRVSLAQAPIRVRADVRRIGDELHFRDVHAAAMRGEVRANGKLRLDGAMPLAVQARFARFDPAEWGDYPQATLNGTLDVQGVLAQRSGSLGFTLADSRLRGVPLSGRGSIEAAEQDGKRRVAAMQAELVVGANRAAARGAFGAPGDELRITLAAPRLAELDPRLQGRVDAQARLLGTWDAPSVVFSASAVDLQYGRLVTLGGTGASGELGWSPGAPLRVDVSAANATAGGLAAERVELRAAGTWDQHAIDVQAAGPRLDLVARMAGGWRADRGWVGSLAALEIRGADRVLLEQATAVEIGPAHVRVGAFTARVADGRIAARETRWAPGRLTTDGEFTRLPVAPLLAIAGVADAVDASLTLNGSWQLAATPRWNGRVHIARDAGDLVFLTDPALPLGLTALQLDADLVEERATGTLVARGAGITLGAEAEAAPVGRGPESGLGRDSPLALKARLNIPSLRPFAVLSGIPASIGGRVQANLAAAGTLGAPLWRGTIDAHEVRVQSPPYGIAWEDGRLRAELTEGTVRLTELAIAAGGGRFTADGVFEQAGAERVGRVTWRADRFAALNRPDRSLTLSGAGTIATEAQRLTLRGALRADSGRFEIDPRSTAVLGDDVVVLGRPDPLAARRAGQRRLPVTLDLDLDLGDDLRVRGAGLDTRLAGRLKVQSLRTGQLVSKGTISTRRGVFYAYGQKLDIERGRLLFDGPIDNPGLDIAAWRRNQAVEAGVEVKGPLRTPLVRVVSNPPVPESEQLAWLVLGRPAESGAQTDYAALQIAAVALLGSADGGRQRSLAQVVGLDEIGFRTEGTTGGQAVALGKRLSDRLYVTYEQSVDAALAVLRLELALTRRFAVRAETGTRSGMDVFYRYSFD